MKNYAAKYMLEEFLGKEHKKEVDFSKNISDVADLALLSNLYECCEEIIGGEPNDLEIIKQKERLSCIEKRIKEVLQINTELAPLALVLDDLDGAFRKPVVWVGERIIELLKEKEPTFTEINRITKFFIRSVDLRGMQEDLREIIIEKIKTISVDSIPGWFILSLDFLDDDLFFFAEDSFRQKAKEIYEALKAEE